MRFTSTLWRLLEKFISFHFSLNFCHLSEKGCAYLKLSTAEIFCAQLLPDARGACASIKPHRCMWRGDFTAGGSLPTAPGPGRGVRSGRGRGAPCCEPPGPQGRQTGAGEERHRGVAGTSQNGGFW